MKSPKFINKDIFDHRSKDNTDILGVLRDIKLSHPEFTRHGGLGYCGYGSKLLSSELDKLNVNHYLLVGEAFRANTEGKAAESFVRDLVLNITDKAGKYAGIRASHIKHDILWPKNTGHVVILVGTTIYDITSGQFGLSSTYPLSSFLNTWVTVHAATLQIDLKQDFNMGKCDRGPIVRITPINHTPLVNRHVMEISI